MFFKDLIKSLFLQQKDYMTNEVSVGIDVGGTISKIGIVDNEGNILSSTTIQTNAYQEVEAFINGLYIKIEECISEIDRDIHLKGIGIGAPNANYYNGTVEHAPNLKWKGILPIVELFRKYYKEIPVVLTNDANAAALGEYYFGGGKEMENFIAITLGTGLGSGIIVNGTLLLGKNSFAGEMGHINMKLDGRKCGCGKRGCLETYVSATGLTRTVAEMLANEDDESSLRDVPFNQLDSKLIAEKAEGGDSIARKAITYTGEILGRALADMVIIFNPEAIFFLGGLANAGDMLLNPARKVMEDNLMEIFKNQTEFMVSRLQLQGKNIAILGAGALVWKAIENNSTSS